MNDSDRNFKSCKLDLEHEICVNVGRLAEHCALHVVMKNVLPDVGRLRWQVGPFRLQLANMIGEFHLAPSHLETLIAGFATKLDPTDPRSKSLLSVSINAALLDVSELRSELVDFDAHLVSPKFFHGNVEFLLEMIVERSVERVPFANFASS